jgi:glycosyltransferase involved in cell wall biosynthesis
MSKSKVSVVVPTYNRAELLPRTIDSVLEQTFREFELFVVDDGSTDDTASVVESYDDDRLTYIQFDENRGANAARNAGIRAASTSFVSFLDSDDEFRSTHLEVVVDRLEEQPARLGGVYTSQRFLEDGDEVDVLVADRELTEPWEAIRDYPAGGFSCWTFRRDVFENVGMLDESLEGVQDREFLIRYLEQYDFAPVEEFLVDHYYHEDRMSENPGRKLSALDKLIDKHSHRFESEDWAYMHYYRGFLYARSGDMSTARREFYLAVKHAPTHPRYQLQLFASLFGATGFDVINDAKRVAKRTLLKAKTS